LIQHPQYTSLAPGVLVIWGGAQEVAEEMVVESLAADGTFRWVGVPLTESTAKHRSRRLIARRFKISRNSMYFQDTIGAMKTKIGTVLDVSLLRQARTVAAREGKRLNQVLEEALAEHLRRKSGGARGGVAARTAGSLKLSRSQVDRILRDEPGMFGG
jgi:hypothetical protein